MSKLATNIKAAKAPNYYKSSLVFLILSIASAAFNYAYYPVIARFLSPSEFGAVQALIAILLQVGAIFSGLNLVTIYVVNKLDLGSAKTAVLILQKLTTSVFVAATLAVTLFQTAVLHFLNIDNRLYIFILALDLITTIPFIIAFGYLQARRQFATAGSLQLAVVLVKLLFGALLAKRFGASGALAGIAVGQTLGMFVFWAVGSFYKVQLWDHKVLAGLSPPKLGELRILAPLAKPATAIFLVNVTLVIYISFSIIAVRHYFEPRLSGLFTGASVLASAIIFVCLPLIGVLLPHLSLKNLAASRSDLAKTTAMVLAVALGSVIFLNIFSSQLLQIFGRDYTAMSYLITRLAIMTSLIAALCLALQVGAFYAPLRSAIISIAGLLTLAISVASDHSSLVSFVSTMQAVFATILLVAILQIIWIYNRGSRQEY
ncbi:hypothetical protein BVY00_01475 [bacterium G20]|nr:hypothetical protein BVY00_01475 [bacterium G20]